MNLDAVQTNIVYFDVPEALEFAAALRARGVDTLSVGPDRIRAVFHLDVSEADTLRTIEILSEIAAT